MLVENIQTLHSHTKNSDGEMSHMEILKTCEDNGITAIAFTDHDSVIDEKNLQVLQDYKGSVKWISGIEISSGLPKELGGGATSDLHITGLFVDPTNKKLIQHCILARKARETRMQKMVSNLTDLGFDITEEDCIKASGGEAVGRPHVVAALVSKPKNNETLEQLRLKMQKEGEKDEEIQKRYNAMMEQGERQYPYAILLSDDAYIPNIYVDYQYFLDLDASVKLIRDAGGVALLAHYFSCARKIDENMLDGMLEDDRLDGLETVYGLFCLNMGGDIERKVDDSLKVVRELVKKHDKPEGGGVDVHTLENIENFVKSKGYSEKTVDMVEEIIKKSGVNTKWSNL